MPQMQVVDLSPIPQAETPLERTLSSFSQRQRANQVDAEERDTLSSIYKEYQQRGNDLDSALWAVQTRPGLSPTSRVNVANQLLQMQKSNVQSQKELAKQQKGLIDEAKKVEQDAKTEAALREGGATDRQISLYKAAPQGGQTQIIGDILEEGSRNSAPIGVPNPDVTDFDKGLTAKERVNRQDQRFTLQTPLVNKNNETLAGLESEGLSIDLLTELNATGKVAEGLNNLNINPKTGDLFIPKLGTPEEQLFVKTVNDFTVKAKDSFGARVTNFELDRFMQRLPTLANSEEGRQLILRQMKIINDLNKMDKKAIQDVFDEYGVRNIDYADAETIARKKISTQKEALRKEYTNLEHLAKKEDASYVQQAKAKAPPDTILMKTPKGKYMYFPVKNKQNLLDKGYQIQ